MTDDDYEILPHKELEYLRKEVERLKKNPYGDTETGKTLLDSMNNLTTSVNRLLAVFETANDEMINDYEDNKTSKRMERLTEQNEKLAIGIVAIGELVKEVLAKDRREGFEELEKLTEKVAPESQTVQPEKPTIDIPESPFADVDTNMALQDIPSLKGLPPPPKKTPANMAPLDDDVPAPPQ